MAIEDDETSPQPMIIRVLQVNGVTVTVMSKTGGFLGNSTILGKGDLTLNRSVENRPDDATVGAGGALH